MPCFLSPVVFGQVLRFLREFLLSGAKSDPKTNCRLYILFQTTKTHVRWIILMYSQGELLVLYPWQFKGRSSGF